VYIYYTLSESDKATILLHLRQADYKWIGFAMFFAVLSHLSRAWRWKYPLAAMGYFPRFHNTFFSVMIGYLANLVLPRVGEASRCAVMARYEQLPFEKLFGTVIAERIADLVVLFLITLTAVVLQFDNLYQLLTQDLSTAATVDTDVSFQGDTMLEVLKAKLPSVWLLAGIGIVLLGLLIGFIWFLRRSKHPLSVKIKKIGLGLWEGIKSIYHMKTKWYFIIHTFFIWFMYIMMFYIAIFSLPGIKNIPFEAVLITFVTGSFGFIIIQGGLGAFPVIVMLTLALYGVDTNEGLAFGWIIWSAQTLLVIILGLLSLVLMPLFNSVKTTAATQ